MRLNWKRHDKGGWFGFDPAHTHGYNAVAVLDRHNAGEWRLMVRDDVDNLDLSIRRVKSAVIGVYPTDEEAKEVADVIYRLQRNVVTS